MQTKLYKNARNGWTAETDVSLPFGNYLQIVTMKRSSGALVTTVTRVKAESGGFSFMPFSDFNKVYATSKVRCTVKSVATQHDEVLLDIELIKSDCESFYKNAEE